MSRAMDSTLAEGPSLPEVESGDGLTDMAVPLRRWREIELGTDVKPGERSGASSVIYQGSLYVFGGYGGTGRLDDIYRFDFVSRCWERVDVQGPVPDGRENNGAIVHGSCMYLFGGYSGIQWLNDFHSFSFDTSTWRAVPSGTKGAVPSTRFGYVSSVHGDFMYIFGGYDGSTWLKDMSDFDFRRGLWSETQVQGFIPSGRSCPSWAQHNGSVYLFGGYDGVHRMNDFYQFHMPSRTWSSVRSLGQVPSPRYFHASVVYGSSLYLFGGYSGQERLNDLYEFRFDCQTWFSMSTEGPPSGRSSLVAEVFNNSLYVFGGYNGSVVLNDFHEFRFEPVSIPPSNLAEDLRRLANNPEFSDVTFLVEDQPVYANRAQLAVRSEYFRELLFGSGCGESSAGSDEYVRLPDVSHSVFLLLLEYIYTDQVGDIPPETAVRLLAAAQRFLLDRLKALCEDSIRKSICIENAISIMMTAKAHQADELKDICMDFIIMNEDIIKSSPTFADLKEDPVLLYELLMRRKPGRP